MANDLYETWDTKTSKRVCLHHAADTATAIRWIQKSAKTYGLDPEHLFTCVAPAGTIIGETSASLLEERGAAWLISRPVPMPA